MSLPVCAIDTRIIKSITGGLKFKVPNGGGVAIISRLKIEIINTGAELMLGKVLNTHQQWLCRQLSDQGYLVSRQVTVDDTPAAIQDAVAGALKSANLVITTGGLGPTSDDRTRDIIAEMFGRKLVQDAAILADIERFFNERKRKAPESVKVQALIPEGATVLANAHGTAPGLVLFSSSPNGSDDKRMLVMLPGPPRELRPMFIDQVLPLIKKHFVLPAPFVCRTLKTTGIGESFLEEKIAAPLAHLVSAGLELGYCARTGEVDLRLVAQGVQAEKIIREAEQITREILGPVIFGEDDNQLEDVIVRLLTERKQTVSLAESCTGGFIANRLTNVSGASTVLLAGVVTYSNRAKQNLLGVSKEALETHGAVSEPVAKEMAEGALERLGTDYAISVTGIAGPTGGTETKPVGTVFIGLATRERTRVRQHRNNYDRETFKYVTSQQALEWLRRTILGND